MRWLDPWASQNYRQSCKWRGRQVFSPGGRAGERCRQPTEALSASPRQASRTDVERMMADAGKSGAITPNQDGFLTDKPLVFL